MSSPTVSSYLGTLQAEPNNTEAFEGIGQLLAEGDVEKTGEQPLRLLEVARHGHEQRGEYSAVANLIQLELNLVDDDPAFKAVLLRELGRIYRDELLQADDSLDAFRKALEIEADEEVERQIEELEQLKEKWRQIADRFVEEAADASDATLKTSMLVRAASLVWQFKEKKKAREVDTLFKQALDSDPGAVRAARLYCVTLRERNRAKDIARVKKNTADSARGRDEKLNLFVQAARLYARELEESEKAAECYARALDFAPGHEESLSYLVEFYTAAEDWDKLVALYEEALRARQKLDSETGILLQLGMVHWRIREDAEAAEPYFSRLRKIDAGHPGMLGFYREYLKTEEDGEQRLLAILADAQRVTEGEAHVELAVEVATLAQEAGATDRAIEAWKTVARLDPTNEDASVALRSLYQEGQRWNALVEVMRGELNALEGDDEETQARRRSVINELIPIYRDHLNLDAMVVSSYKSLLDMNPGDTDASERLADTYESMGRWNDLIQLLSELAEKEEDESRKIALRMRIARLWIDRFANYNQATKPLESIIEIDPENRDALGQLKKIYSKKRAWPALYEVLKKESVLASDPNARLEMKVELAELAGGKLHRNDEAIELWSEIVDEEPDREGALDQLERLADREKNWAALAKALELRALQEEDSAKLVKNYQRLGVVYGEHLDDQAKAAESWRSVLALEPKNGRALRTLRDSFLKGSDWDGLRALYEDAGDFEGFVETLGRAADESKDDERTKQLSFMAAAVYENEIGDPERAFRSYERVLTVDPENAQAADALCGIYRSQEKWARLVRMHEIVLGTFEAGSPEHLERIDAIIDVNHNRLTDDNEALRFAKMAYDLQPESDARRNQLEELGAKAGRYDLVDEAFKLRLESGDCSDDETLTLRRKRAVIASEHLGQTDEAVAALKAVLESRPEDVDAMDALERLYRENNRTSDLREILLHRFAHAQGDDQQRDALNALGQLEEDVLEDLDSACERYRAVLGLFPEDETALVALDRMLTQREQWSELAPILEKRRELSRGSDDELELCLRHADLQRNALENVESALEGYRDVLSLDGMNAQAIAGLEALLEHEAVADGAGRALEPSYEANGEYEKLAGVLSVRLQNIDDAEEKREVHLRLAEMAGATGDNAAAYAALEAAFLDRPNEPELWDRLSATADAAGKHADLAAAFSTAIESGGLEEPDIVELSMRAAEVYDVLLGDPASSEVHHKRLLQIDPLHERAFYALKEFYTEQENWESLQQLYRNRIAETYDQDAKLELLQQLCFLFEEILEDRDQAIRTYQEVLELQPDHGPSRRALEGLFRSRERWRDLVEHLRYDLDNAESDPERIELLFTIGKLHESNLNEPAFAVDRYEAVLELSPTHVRAQDSLRGLLDESSERQRVATILEPLYEGQGAWPELANVLRVQLEASTEPGDQVSLNTRLAKLYEERTGEPERAIQALGAAVLADAADPGLREELSRVATMTGASQKRAEILEEAIGSADSDHTRAELLLEVAELYDAVIGDHEAAERSYKQLIQVDGNNPDSALPAARALERIHMNASDYEALVEDLRLQIRLEYEPETRAELLGRLALLLEEQLGNPEAAIAAQRERLEILPDSRDTLFSLERLYEKSGDWQRLIGVLQQRDQASSDELEQTEIGLRVGELYESKLEDPGNAIVAYNDVLSRFGPSEPVLNSLERLYRSESQWDDLLEIIEMKRDSAMDSEAIARLWVQTGDVQRVNMSEHDRAVEAYQEALNIHPDCEGAVSSLEEILTDPDSRSRIDAARAVVPFYEANAKHEELVGALETLAESEDSVEKIGSLRRAAEIAELGLEKPEDAFRLMGQAVQAAVGEEDLPHMLSDFGRYAQAASKWKEYVDLMEGVTPEIFQADLQTETWLTVASRAQFDLEDPERAKGLYARALESQPDSLSALEALETLHRDLGEHAELVQILERKTELATDGVGRIGLLEQRASVAEEHLNDSRSAADAYEQVLLEDETHLPAYEALQRLYTKDERWDDLTAVLERQIDVGVGSQVAANHALGEVHRLHLSDLHQALDHYRQAVEADAQFDPSIAALAAVMEGEELRGEAAEILEPVYLARMDWPAVKTALEARFSTSDDPSARRDILLKLGQIHEDYLEDLSGAFGQYSRLFDEDWRDRETWTTLGRLGRVLEDHQRLADTYARPIAEEGVSDDDSAELARMAARLYQGLDGQTEKVTNLFEQVLEFDAADGEAFESLERVYASENANLPLAKLYRGRADAVSDEAERVDLLHRLARSQRSAGAIDDSIETYRELLGEAPEDGDANESIESLLLGRERFEELAGHLEQRVDYAANPTDRAVLKQRLALVRLENLSDPDGAMGLLEEILEEVPNTDTVAALEGFFDDPERSVRAGEILEPIYRADDNWQRLARVLQDRADKTDPLDAIPLLSEVAQIRENRGGDERSAFAIWARVMQLDPQDSTSASELSRLAAAHEMWGEYVQALEGAVQGSEDPDASRALLETIAQVHDAERGDPRAAIQTYERIAELDPDDMAPLDSLEGLHTMVADWKGMVAVLERKVERSFDPVVRAEFLRRAGSVQEELLADVNGAMIFFERAAEEDPSDPIALESLDRIYESASDHESLARVLQRRFEVEGDDALRVDIGLRRASILETQLGQLDEAISVHQEILEIEPSQRSAMQRLGNLYERRAMWPDLLENLQSQASLVETVDDRVALVQRAGEITERELDDVHGAIDLYEQALELDARHEPALGALIRVSRLADYRGRAAELLEPRLVVQERWEDLAELRHLKAEAATDPYDRKAELLALAEVCRAGLRDNTRTFDALSAALVEDGADEDVAAQIESLAAEMGAFEKAAETFNARASHALDPMVARAHYERVARISELHLGDSPRAIRALERAVEQVGDEAELLASLDRLYTDAGQMGDVARVVERRVHQSSDSGERASLLVRLGSLRAEHFGDLRGALTAFQEVVEDSPANAEAISGLESLTQHEELALDAAEALEAAYRATGEQGKIAGLYDVRVRLAETDDERVRLLTDAARLWEDELGDPAAAQRAYRQAFELDPRDEQTLDAVERLTAMTGDWESLRGMVERASTSDLDSVRRRDLQLRAASWYRDRLGDIDAAEASLRTAIEVDPEGTTQREQLVDLLRESARHEELCQALRDWAEVEFDVGAKIDRLREVAELSEHILMNQGLAIDAHERILNSDASELHSMNELIRLYPSAGKWAETASLLERRIDEEMDPNVRLDLRRQCAEIYAGPLDNAERATATFEGILEENPADLPAQTELQRLYEEAQRWDDLEELLGRRLNQAENTQDQISARVALARLAEKAFGRSGDAIAQLNEILAIDPNNHEALEELDRLYGETGELASHVELLTRRADLASSVADNASEVGFLVRAAEIQAGDLADPAGARDSLLRARVVDSQNLGVLQGLAGLLSPETDPEALVGILEAQMGLVQTEEIPGLAHRVAEVCEQNLGDPQRAAMALRQSLNQVPTPETRTLLKSLYERHEAWHELIELLDAEVELAPSDEEKVLSLKQLADISEQRLGDPATAAQFLERASQLAPEDRDVLLPLCDLYIAAGRQQDAVPVLEQIIASYGNRRSKELAQFHHRLGRALEGMGNAEGALQHYDSAFRIDLTSVPVLRDLGRLCYLQQNWERAQRTFRALLLQKLKPEDGITKADVCFYLGDITAHLGDTRKAISMLERALSEDREHAQAQARLAELKG